MPWRADKPHPNPWALALAIALVLIAAPARAEERDFCPARPGLATPPCIVDTGHVAAELGLADWTLDRDGDQRQDQFIAGDLLLRVGLDAMSEAQIGLTTFGAVRLRERTGIGWASGLGDMTLAWKRSLAHPDGGGLSVAVQPFVTLPTGGSAIGAGDWGAGLILPVSLPLGGAFQLALSPEVDAAVDSDGRGRHAAFGLVTGLDVALGKALSGAVELSEMHDADPAGTQDHGLAAASLAWQPARDWQLDVGTVASLDPHGPDLELYLGVARRF